MVLSLSMLRDYGLFCTSSAGANEVFCLSFFFISFLFFYFCIHLFMQCNWDNQLMKIRYCFWYTRLLRLIVPIVVNDWNYVKEIAVKVYQ